MTRRGKRQGRLLSQLLRLRGRYAVPRRTAHSIDYASRASLPGARWHRSHPATPVELPPPLVHGEATDWGGSLATAFPQRGVLELPGGYLVGRSAWVTTPDGWRLPDHAWTEDGRTPRRMRDRSFRVEELPGTTASLVSDFSLRNYAHFLFDGLSRLELIEAAGLDVDAIDRFLVIGPEPAFRRALDRLGIPESRRLQPRRGLVFRCERLLAATFPALPRHYAPWQVAWARERFAAPPSRTDRRLYARRSGSRRIQNEEELLPILERHGFEAFDAKDHDDPTSVFAEAEAVVGVHGANLADLFACPPGAKVLELMPENHQHPYWYTMAAWAGLRYGYLLVPAEGERLDPRRPHVRNVHVDPETFERALERTLNA